MARPHRFFEERNGLSKWRERLAKPLHLQKGFAEIGERSRDVGVLRTEDASLNGKRSPKVGERLVVAIEPRQCVRQIHELHGGVSVLRSQRAFVNGQRPSMVFE